MTDQNNDLHGTLLNKNTELEDTYRKLQEELRGGSRMKVNDASIDKLEDGLREAINSNY